MTKGPTSEPEQLPLGLDVPSGGMPGPSRQRAWEMFDRIAGRYDLLNRLLSFGCDQAWRRRVVRYLPERGRLKILDLATGTADQLIMLTRVSGRIDQGVGMDMAGKMLEVGREKIRRKGLTRTLTLEEGDAVHIPSEDEQYDVVTISFGIRNVVDVDRALGEMLRVLRPGGVALVLEFSLPASSWFKPLYLFYLRHVLPRLGGILSGDTYAYRYLNATIESFPYGEAFCRLMREVGFQRPVAHAQTLGIATIYEGRKRREA